MSGASRTNVALVHGTGRLRVEDRARALLKCMHYFVQLGYAVKDSLDRPFVLFEYRAPTRQNTLNVCCVHVGRVAMLGLLLWTQTQTTKDHVKSLRVY